MVYGGLRNGGCVAVGGDLRVSTRHGDEDTNDLFADMLWIHPGLYCGGIGVATIVLPA